MPKIINLFCFDLLIFTISLQYMMMMVLSIFMVVCIPLACRYRLSMVPNEQPSSSKTSSTIPPHRSLEDCSCAIVYDMCALKMGEFFKKKDGTPSFLPLSCPLTFKKRGQICDLKRKIIDWCEDLNDPVHASFHLTPDGQKKLMLLAEICQGWLATIDASLVYAARQE